MLRSAHPLRSTSLLSVAFAALLSACLDQPTSLLDGTGGNPSGGGQGAGAPGGAGSVGGSGTGASGDGGDGGAPAQPATFELSATPVELELRSSVDTVVSIAPNGYVGPVALSIAGGPSDVQAELGASSVTLDGSTVETVPLTLTTASSTQTGAFVVTVVGTVPSGEKSVDAALIVEPVITIIIPENLASYSAEPPSTDAFGDFPTIVKALPNMSDDNPITVHFFNADTLPHEIHADNPNEGFPHGNQPIPPGAFDPVVRRVNSPGEYLFYPHDIDASILGRIDIE
jgi:hypothetical protein